MGLLKKVNDNQNEEYDDYDDKENEEDEAEESKEDQIPKRKKILILFISELFNFKGSKPFKGKR